MDLTDFVRLESRYILRSRNVYVFANKRVICSKKSLITVNQANELDCRTYLFNSYVGKRGGLLNGRMKIADHLPPLIEGYMCACQECVFFVKYGGKEGECFLYLG